MKISFPFALPSMRTGTLVEKSRVLLGLQDERGKDCRSGPERMERSRREGRQGRERKGGVGIENEPEMIGQIKKNRYFCRLIW